MAFVLLLRKELSQLSKLAPKCPIKVFAFASQHVHRPAYAKLIDEMETSVLNVKFDIDNFGELFCRKPNVALALVKYVLIHIRLEETTGSSLLYFQVP